MIAAYLSAERDLGRIAEGADVETLAATLIGSSHLLYADRTTAPPTSGTLHKTTANVLAASLRNP